MVYDVRYSHVTWFKEIQVQSSFTLCQRLLLTTLTKYRRACCSQMTKQRALATNAMNDSRRPWSSLLLRSTAMSSLCVAREAGNSNDRSGRREMLGRSRWAGSEGEYSAKWEENHPTVQENQRGLGKKKRQRGIKDPNPNAQKYNEHLMGQSMFHIEIETCLIYTFAHHQHVWFIAKDPRKWSKARERDISVLPDC
jgi:hypothetical protein